MKFLPVALLRWFLRFLWKVYFLELVEYCYFYMEWYKERGFAMVGGKCWLSGWKHHLLSLLCNTSEGSSVRWIWVECVTNECTSQLVTLSLIWFTYFRSLPDDACLVNYCGRSKTNNSVLFFFSFLFCFVFVCFCFFFWKSFL